MVDFELFRRPRERELSRRSPSSVRARASGQSNAPSFSRLPLRAYPPLLLLRRRELDVITTVPRSNTVHAIRDTELARMPLTLFNAISTRHPATTLKFLRLIATRVTKEVDTRSHRAAPPPGALELTPSNLNLKTICILPSSRNVPVAVFANKLKAALEDIGSPTAYLDQTTVSRHLGRHTFSTMGKLKVRLSSLVSRVVRATVN
jgi:hypothetical protein